MLTICATSLTVAGGKLRLYVCVDKIKGEEDSFASAGVWNRHERTVQNLFIIFVVQFCISCPTVVKLNYYFTDIN